MRRASVTIVMYNIKHKCIYMKMTEASFFLRYIEQILFVRFRVKMLNLHSEFDKTSLGDFFFSLV